ncbi:MAG TPA: hypothetical protein IAA56_00445 [Candidatus Galloscillospira excrementavium]|nr:hypothetical protein [Candidatus Galloscillospira excrementavium]
MTLSIKGRGASVKLSLAAAAVGLISLIAFLIYGAVYPVYADFGVGIFLLLGVLGYLAYAFFDLPVLDFAPLAAVFCTSFGMGLFALNAYPVLGDWYGNFNMYGSEGGIVPVIIILAITLVSIVCGIVTCFTRKQKGGN